MHPPHVRAEALRLIAAGVNDCEISRRTGIARTTIRDWRRPTYVPRGSTGDRGRHTCARCWRAMRPVSFTASDYCELLGLYLGDGCIDEMPRTQRMRISMDARYPVLNANVYELLGRCFPANQAGFLQQEHASMVVMTIHNGHLTCLFPQHGPGKKHERDVSLEGWQLQIVRRAPFALLRGLIWSDGCHFVNRTGRYEYFSYEFKNLSTEIREVFAGACDLAGIEYTCSGSEIWIRRRESVHRMLEHVGVKA